VRSNAHNLTATDNVSLTVTSGGTPGPGPGPDGPRVSIAKSLAGASSVQPNTRVTYILRITNTGTVTLTDLVVTDPLPSRLSAPQIVSRPANATGGFSGNTLTINLASLAPGATAEIRFSAIAASGTGVITNTATVRSNAHNLTATSSVNLTVTPTAPPPPPPPHFDPTHRAFIVGYPDGTVRPHSNMTRAEVATLFFRLFTDDYRTQMWSQTNTFPDVFAHNWFNNAVSTVANAGFISGMPNGHFEPNRPITRAEFATLASRFVDASATGINVFPDTEGHWAVEHINNISRFGWVTGYTDGNFRPDQNITRAEVAALVNRMLERRPQNHDDLLPGMITWPDNANRNAWYYLDIQEATNSHTHTMKPDGIHETWTRLITPRQWTALERPNSRPSDIVYSWNIRG